MSKVKGIEVADNDKATQELIDNWDRDLLDDLESKQVQAYYTVSGLSTLLDCFRTYNGFDMCYDATENKDDSRRESWNKAVDVLEYAIITLRSCADMLKA